MSEWINVNDTDDGAGNITEETASALRTRLESLGACFKVSSSEGSAIAYSANGLILRQAEKNTVFEVRALTRTAAERLQGLRSDSTSQIVYYAQIGTSTDYATCGITTGAKTTVNITRSNEANGWRATISVIEYSALDTSGWSTTAPSAASTSGLVTSIEYSTELIFSVWWYINGSNSNTINHFARLYRNCVKSTLEYRYLTYAEALAKLNSFAAQNTPSSSSIAQIQKVTSGSGSLNSSYHTAEIWLGTKINGSMSYIDAEHGWTVFATQWVYTAAALYYRVDNYGTTIGVNATTVQWKLGYLNITATPYFEAALS